ncbi:hypothetical protein Rxyl_1919 [Rubrobacter xylanophilus DSM 9941]|uniref:Transposase n=1 Tax=Rubrobacter xylanophilus (strain DSM 9941 / JCM 11954 / NBRC 16129 / PRD-1) TaxID=266117 RepID=Q1AUR2_RUBXD|nr:helix-turn-helix domain-containing protein [Rubrobacter xylanophilus]ABG04866.1 hypothetical protein Rxyl_1919 [Rubrobacter xylanophilus DSM 9941]
MYGGKREEEERPRTGPPADRRLPTENGPQCIFRIGFGLRVTVRSMKSPIFVRSLSENEREDLEAGLRSKDAFVMRRSQILLASSRGEKAPKIAENLGCGTQTVRDAIHDFNERGPDALVARSSRPKRTRDAFDEESAERLRGMLHRSPREFGRESSLWTLEMAAEVAFEEGLTQRRVSGETIRATLARLLGVRWQRAKRWITSPDPLYERKKEGATC